MSDWGWDSATCWGDFAQDLRSRGYEVLLPQWEVAGTAPEPAPASAPSSNDLTPLLRQAALWAEPLRGRGDPPLVAVAVGWSGAALIPLLEAAPQLQGLVWVAPRLETGSSWEIPAGHSLGLLLIAADSDLESSAVAMNLFARFNQFAELRLFGGDLRSCMLVERSWVRQALAEWLMEPEAR